MTAAAALSSGLSDLFIHGRAGEACAAIGEAMAIAMVAVMAQPRSRRFMAFSPVFLRAITDARTLDFSADAGRLVALPNASPDKL